MLAVACMMLLSQANALPHNPKHMPTVPMPVFDFSVSTQLSQRHPAAKGTKKTMRAHKVMYSGSLKANILRLSKAYGWSRVIWAAPNDYHWVGALHFSTQSYESVLWRVLKNYPLQANFYEGNRVLVIKPRVIRT